MTSLLANVVAREPLAAADGRSGSLLERVTLGGGEALVVKHVLDGGDWIMRGCHDHGRAAQLWSDGVLARIPAVIDHAVVGAEPVEGGWLVIMRDVSAALVPDHLRIGRDDSRRVLEAAAALHAAFAGDPPLALCSMADRYQLLSPATTRREAGGTDEVPKLIGRGWERFAELVPGEVTGPVLEIMERPEPFVAALSRSGSTLIHGDLKLGNLGFDGDRVVMLDWGTQTGWAPPAVEVAWYLAVNWSRIDATREQVLDDFRAAEGDRHDEDALRLALLGGLVQLGWDKALHASGHPDPAIRAREAADLAWWTERARDALGVWSPS
jgi:hypothetical protein